MRLLVGLAASCALLAFAGSAQAEDAVAAEDPEVILSSDAWFLRFDIGAAYTRAVTRYRPSSGGSAERPLESWAFAGALELAVGARLGRDVTLGALGNLTHAPVTQWEGEWHSRSQGMYYAAMFLDHRLPAKVLRLGGAVGPGRVYAPGPEPVDVSGWGPVGSIWLGLDVPNSSRVALGLTADVTGAAARDHVTLGGIAHDANLFLLSVGLSMTLRISEPSWPKTFPKIARRERDVARAHSAASVRTP